MSILDDLPRGTQPKLRMTEEEFLNWIDEDTRAEWVDGEVIIMAPASGEHSDLGGWLYMFLRHFVEERDLGLIRGPEFMIRLKRRRRVPDILFISKDRLGLVGKNHLEGAPDLAIEIVSPDSQSRDWREKYLEYEKAGVREYWVIDPASQHVEAYSLGQNNSFHRIVEQDEKITSTVLPGLYLRPTWLWQLPMPRVAAVLRELGISL